MPSGSELVCGRNHSRLASHYSRLRVSSRRRSRTAGTIPGRPRQRSCRAAGRGQPRARPGSAPPSPASGSPDRLGHSTGCGHDGRERRLGRGRERTRAANSSRAGVPGSSPASRSCARRPFSFGTAYAAVSAWRVSMHAMGRPAGAKLSWVWAASEHASRPIRSTASPSPWTNATRGWGSLGTRASFTIAPAPSTARTVPSSSETSSLAKRFTAALPRCSWPTHADHALTVPFGAAAFPARSPNHPACSGADRPAVSA